MSQFNKVTFREDQNAKSNDFKTTFELSPLERGFANTIGNAVRRVLLSSIQGVSTFAIKIKGVSHEFSPIEGVKEDAVAVILNLKDVRFIFNRDIFTGSEVIKVTLKSSKAGTVTANDLVLPAGVEVVNREQIIAEVTQADALEMELFVTSGRGFRSFEENKKFINEVENKMESNITVGEFIAIDSDFSPVVNVSYKSEEMNSASAIIEEKLTIDVETDGSVMGKDAIAQASKILIDHLKELEELSPETTKEDTFSSKDVSNEESEAKTTSVADLNLSVRSYNSLKRAQIATLEQLSNLTVKELKAIQNLGKKSVEEIMEKLEQHNVTLEEGE